MSDNSRMEIMWGVPLLDEGFTSIPNLLIRNYRKLGIEHGEWGMICAILTYKHDHRDPYPSRSALCEHLCCSEKQITKWVTSLKNKGFIRRGQRKNPTTNQWNTAVYNFKPLLDSLMKLVGEKPMPDPKDDYEIIWDEPSVPEVAPAPVPLQVAPEGEPEVAPEGEPEVAPKKKKEKEKKKNKNDDDEAATPQVDINHLYLTFKFDSKADFFKTHDEVKKRVDSEYEKDLVGNYPSYFWEAFKRAYVAYQNRKAKWQENRERGQDAKEQRYLGTSGKPADHPSRGRKEIVPDWLQKQFDEEARQREVQQQQQEPEPDVPEHMKAEWDATMKWFNLSPDERRETPLDVFRRLIEAK